MLRRTTGTAEADRAASSRSGRLMRWWPQLATQWAHWLGGPVGSLSALGGVLRGALLRGPAGQALHASSSALAATSADSRLPPSQGRRPERPALRQLVDAVVLPELARRSGPRPIAAPALQHRIDELARLLAGNHPQAAGDMVREVYGLAGSLVRLLSGLVEPAACRLGDLWRDDDCSETDVTLGLCHLLAAVRELELDRSGGSRPRDCIALFSPLPGERHVLGTALHAELAWQAGWQSRVEFPATGAALQGLLSANWFDLLDLSLSAAFRRDHCMQQMTDTVALARASSMNPNLVVVVSGRLFQEDPGASHAVGADGSGRSALHFGRLLRLASGSDPGALQSLWPTPATSVH